MVVVNGLLEPKNDLATSWGFEIQIRSFESPGKCVSIYTCSGFVAYSALGVDNALVKHHGQRISSSSHDPSPDLTNKGDRPAHRKPEQLYKDRHTLERGLENTNILLNSTPSSYIQTPVQYRVKDQILLRPVLREAYHLPSLAFAASTTLLPSAGVLSVPSSPTTFTSHLFIP